MIPRIQQQPRTANDSAIHYGYVAFKEIFVGDRQVQPSESPYRKELPCRELVPFTNVEELRHRADVTSVQGVNRPLAGKNGADPTVERVPKSARECVEEIAWAYEEWGFLKVSPLTGYDEADADFIMQTIQPHPYKLKDLMEGLEGAQSRIAATESYVVEYGDMSVELQPLPEGLKAVAEQALKIITTSADIGVRLAEEIEAATRQKMETYFATGEGKRVPDPHDRRIFEELGKTIPTRLTADDQLDPLKRLADIMASGYVKPDQGATDRIAEKEARLDAALAKVEAMLAAQAVAPTKSQYSRGDIVEVNGEQAEVIDTRFGRTKVRMPDGTEVNI